MPDKNDISHMFLFFLIAFIVLPVIVFQYDYDAIHERAKKKTNQSKYI